MVDLKKELDALLDRSPDAAQVREALETLFSVFPFNEYEYIISHLLGNDILTLGQYSELRDEYIARNMYLYIFEISGPRTFGESWAQGHLKELVPDLSKSTKKLDPEYSGQYDFLLDGKIKIEVKASRGVHSELEGPLYVRALASDSGMPFWMNFQQVKCGCCDVFVWVAVWRDVIKYWVLSSAEVGGNRHYSKGQHRGNTGEGQLHITQDNISDFDQYAVPSNRLGKAIRAAYKRQKASSLE